MQRSGRTPSKKVHNWDRECGSIRESQGGGWGRAGEGGAPGGRQVGSLSPAVREAQRLQNKTEKESENIDGNSIRFLSFFFGLILLDNDLVPAASLLQAVIIDI